MSLLISWHYLSMKKGVYVTWDKEGQAHLVVCMGCAYLSNSLVISLIEEAVATPLMKDIWTWFSDVAASLSKRYSYFTQRCSCPSCEEYFNFKWESSHPSGKEVQLFYSRVRPPLLWRVFQFLSERAAASLSRRYSYFTQGCGHPLEKGILIFSDKVAALL